MIAAKPGLIDATFASRETSSDDCEPMFPSPSSS